VSGAFTCLRSRVHDVDRHYRRLDQQRVRALGQPPCRLVKGLAGVAGVGKIAERVELVTLGGQVWIIAVA
jgi:hypothetical protein